MRKFIAIVLVFSIHFHFVGSLFAAMFSWDFPEGASSRKEKERAENSNQVALAESANLPVQYPSAEFDPVLEPGMILVIESLDASHPARTAVPIMSDEIVTVPGLGVLEIVGKKLSFAADVIRKQTNENFRTGVMMGTVQTVQVLGKVQKPGNYPGYMKLSYIIAEAVDRAPGSNFTVHFYNGANRTATLIRYEDIVKGKNNPLVPPGSVVYFPPSAGSIFGEMTEKQINLAYLIVITLGALGISLIAKQ